MTTDSKHTDAQTHRRTDTQTLRQLEYVTTGERPAYLRPEDKAAWQWQVSEVKAGRY